MNENKPMFIDISKIDSNPYQTRLGACQKVLTRKKLKTSNKVRNAAKGFAKKKALN